MSLDQNLNKILIIDFGSQFTQLITRRIRELGVFSEIITIKDLKKIKDYNVIKGIILSGGPSTVTKKKFPNIPKEIFQKKIPILGICYGMEVLYSFYYGRRVKLLKTRNVNTFDVCLDQRYREAKVIGEQFRNVKFNHKSL